MLRSSLPQNSSIEACFRHTDNCKLLTEHCHDNTGCSNNYSRMANPNLIPYLGGGSERLSAGAFYKLDGKYFWSQGKTLPISYTAIHSLYVWPGLLMSPNTLILYCTSSKISYQLTMPYMAATSAYKSFINLFPVYPYILQSLTKLLLYVKNPMEYFTTQQNTRN